MPKTYTCRDVGVDCDWKTTGATVEEVMQSIREHAAKEHGMSELAPDLRERVVAAIKDQ